MTYIRIDTKSKQAQKFVELVKTMPFAKILQEPNTVTKKAMADTVKNKTTKHKNAKELIASLNK
jgi:antitoxin component of RelBE/YafQ-DinJ toxin-antitoxin module